MDSHGNVPCKHTKSDSDRISNLPDDITERILGRLPIRDAVRTSILSRNWRHKWTTLPRLVFDDEKLQNDVEGNKLVEIISSILFRHKKDAPISKFSLSVKTITNDFMMDQWLHCLSDKGTVTEFILRIFSQVSRYYIVHSSLFSFTNLTHLVLQNCILPSSPPIIFNGFHNLTRLELIHVTFSNEGFEHLIRNCPKLRELILFVIEGLDRLSIHHAPNLETLLFVSLQIKYVSLMYAPSLLHVAFSAKQKLANGDQSASLVNNLHGLSNVKSLTLGWYFLKFLGRDNMRLPPTFNNLSEVKFRWLMFQDIDSVSFAIGLITSSPNLHTLRVESRVLTDKSFVAQAQMEATTKHMEQRSESIVPFLQLRFVEMKDITGSRPEMQFIKMILGYSPMLKQMKIKQATMFPVTASKILRELNKFPRASAIAEVDFN